VETKNIILSGQPYQLIIERKKIKNIILRILSEKSLHISAPFSVPMDVIEQFVYGKESWILKVEKKIEERQNARKQLLTQNTIVFLGKRRKLELIKGSFPKMTVEEDRVVLQLKEMTAECFQKTWEDQAKKALQQWCQKLRIRYDQMLDDYHLGYPEIHFRKMTSKWGSCIPAKSKITLNMNLIYYPIQCLDYVLLHEYAHLIMPNHSERFYRIIEMRMPNYREIQKILRES